MKWLTSVLLRMRRRTGFALIAISVGIVFAYHLGSGVVVDEATGLPIEGVYVVARFSARAITPVNSSPRVRLVVVSIGTTNPGAQWEDNEIRTSIQRSSSSQVVAAGELCGGRRSA